MPNGFPSRSRAIARSSLLALGVLITTACPLSTGPEDPDPPIVRPPEPPPPPPPPPPPAASVPTGTPAIYISTSSDASIFNNIIGDVIEGSRQNFVQFVPATGEAALIDSNLSVSYARSRSTIKTFDDQLYIVNVSETSARIRRFDNEALLSSPADRPVPTPAFGDSLEEDCMVVDGDDLIYKVAWRRARFPGIGYADGPLVRVADYFQGQSDISTLIEGLGRDSPTPGGFVTEACQFHMDWADGVWYDVANRVEFDDLTIYTRDAASGIPTIWGQLPNMGDRQARYQVSNISFDRGWAYVAQIDVPGQMVEVIAYPGGRAFWQLVARIPLTGMGAESVHHLDVDDGHIAFVVTGPDGDDYVALVSPSGESELISVGAAANQLQILYRQE